MRYQMTNCVKVSVKCLGTIFTFHEELYVKFHAKRFSLTKQFYVKLSAQILIFYLSKAKYLPQLHE